MLIQNNTTWAKMPLGQKVTWAIVFWYFEQSIEKFRSNKRHFHKLVQTIENLQMLYALPPPQGNHSPLAEN